jgi:hypothetical protein
MYERELIHQIKMELNELDGYAYVNKDWTMMIIIGSLLFYIWIYIKHATPRSENINHIQYCSKCVNAPSGISCEEFNFNIKEYPKNFLKKCKGNFYEERLSDNY